jgi:putative redox protein
MDTVRAKWNGKRRFIAWDEAGHGVVMDATAEHKGEGTGARPLEILLYSLAGCTGIDIVSILEKQRQDVTDFELVVTAEQREERPRRYERVHIQYIVTGHDVKASAVERAVSLSEEKYCSVSAMFDPAIEVTSEFRVVEA